MIYEASVWSLCGRDKWDCGKSANELGSVYMCVSVYEWVILCVCVCECIPPPFKHDPFQCSHHKLQDKSFWLITEWQLYVLCHQWTGYCPVIDYFYANQWIRGVLPSICGPQTGVMFMSFWEIFEKTQIYSHLVLSRMLWGWKKTHIVVFFSNVQQETVFLHLYFVCSDLSQCW